jgi:hypothetical protein
MAFLVGGANSAAAADTGLTNSLRFNNDAELEFTPGSEGNRTTFTISVWVKRGGLGTDFICSSGTGSGAKFELSFGSSDQLWAEDKSGVILQTTAKYRDPSAWMHIVFKHDSTPATPGSSDVALYVNGSQITSFDTYETYPSQNAQGYWMDDEEHNIGKRTYSDIFFDGYMAEFVAIDGLALSPSSFGETDEDSGIWKPKDVSGLTFGTNGFYLEFKETGTNQDSSGIGADTSGNNNHFAVTSLAATDQCTDTPANNFCTLNPLAKGSSVTLSEGNLKYVPAETKGTVGTFGLTKGKWYWEIKAVDVGSNTQIGLYDGTDGNGFPTAYLGSNSSSWGIISNDGNSIHNTSQASYGDSFSDNDIIQVALDMDNGEWYVGENGTYYNSGDPAASTNPAHTTVGDGTGTIHPAISNNNTTAVDFQFNFGSPPFAISSGNADANGYGNFEYEVPSGYYALCTKNLAEYG